jgi:acetolactate synthase-1/3 small subunit
MKHTIAVYFENRLNTIPRITGLFSGRGFNIDSISFGPGEEPDITRMTITTRGEEQVIEQITKQLHKLVDVTKVIDMTYEPYVERQLALVKVACSPSTQSDIMQLATIFRANIVDISPKTVTVEITGKEDKVNAAIGLFRQHGLQEVSRTGTVALKREFQGQV